MLLRFGVDNFRSLKSPQELSLIASQLDDNPIGLLNNKAVEEKLLPAVVIYGANASGKSNLLRAIDAMRRAIVFSHSRIEPGENLPFQPFALDPKCSERPSTFDADFIVDGVRYHYGFQQTLKVFESEWLYAFPSGKRRALFTRSGQKFSFGRHLRGQNEIISSLTRPNSLFISAAAQNNHELLSQIVKFFRSISSQVPLSVKNIWALMAEDDRPALKRAVALLRELGTGIVSFRKAKVEPLPIEEPLLSELDAIFRKHVKEYGQAQANKAKIELGHAAADGSQVYFNLSEESDGTRRLLVLLEEAFKALERGTILIIDELNASLHTQACEKILSLFANPENNPKGAQIIATTHDTNLLGSAYIRRDQVWFTEQQPDGSTMLFPLTDLKTRKGDNIERGYLQGRYGAVPFQGRWAASGERH